MKSREHYNIVYFTLVGNFYLCIIIALHQQSVFSILESLAECCGDHTICQITSKSLQK